MNAFTVQRQKANDKALASTVREGYRVDVTP